MARSAASSRGPGALRAALLALGALLLGAAWLSAGMPRAQAAHLEPAPGVVGVDAGRSLAWILRTRNGAALIDAGYDRDARALLAELRAQGLDASKVHTVLITHGHPDHWAGAAMFPAARVLAGAGDVPLLLGKARLRGPASFALSRVMPPPLPQVTAVADGQVLDVDGEEVRAIALPGHTPGSTAYLW
ncbi:MAG TPA: MBL fold metallo-hydrolase, partial [Myxococcales bacterium]|nr:MBL fold metallo-hydrolase [Myxococcales bacterium]